MTHSGQGDGQQLPAARPAHEGVVLPADGSEPFLHGAQDTRAAPAGGQPWGEPWGPQQQQPAQPGAYGQQERQPSAYGQQERQPSAYGQQERQQAEQVHPGASDATQYIPPVAAAAPGGPGQLPPEAPAESTTFLGTRPLQQSGPAPVSDADATQYLPPVPAAPTAAPYGIRPGAPGDQRRPPAEFDSLFRTDGPAPQGADATRHLPRIDEGRPPRQAYPRQRQAAAPPQQYQQPRYEPDSDERGSRERSSSRVPVVAAVVIGCAVLGLGVSALMFSGDDDKNETSGPGTNVAASSPAPSSNSPKAAEDPAKTQAEELDKLLGDSNDSRTSVIRSVENIKKCENLDQAATDLSAAAQQRRSLATRLDGLTVDKLPGNAELTAALKQAWESSAKADDHYAAWAQQVKGKKGCKDGRARNTGQTALANRASGDATKAKREASALWNTIADTHGLTKRGSDQL